MSTFTVYQRVPNDLFEDSSPHPCAPLPLFTSLLISLCLCLFIHLLISLVVSLSISLPYLFPCLFRYWFPYAFPYFPRIPWTLATRATRMRVASTPPPLVCILPPGPSRLLISKIMDTVPSASIQKKKDLARRRGSRRRAKGDAGECSSVFPPKKMRLTWGLIPYTTDFWTGIHVFLPSSYHFDSESSLFFKCISPSQLIPSWQTKAQRISFIVHDAIDHHFKHKEDHHHDHQGILSAHWRRPDVKPQENTRCL